MATHGLSLSTTNANFRSETVVYSGVCYFFIWSKGLFCWVSSLETM